MTRLKPACWRWEPPAGGVIADLTEEMRLKRIDVWGTEERALKKLGPLEEDVRWRLMQQFQNGRCAVCAFGPRDGPDLVIDHDHESDFIRGFLCRSCNTLEGCGGHEVFDMYRERHPAMICGLRARYTTRVLPPGFVLPPCPW